MIHLNSSSNDKLGIRLAAYATTAGAMIITASQAKGQLMYSGIQNLLFDEPGILNPLDLDGDGVTDFNVGLAWDSGIFNIWDTYSAFIQNAGTTNGWIGTTFNVFQLSLMYTVSSGRTWTNYVGDYYNLGVAYYGNFLGSGNALMGITWIIYDGAPARHFGWMRVNIDRAATEFVVVDWAYSAVPLGPIPAGALPSELIPPEPSLTSSISVHTGEDFQIEIHFSEPISSFTTSDIEVVGGSAVPGSLSTSDDQNFVVIVHPEVDGIVEINIPGSVVQDLDGNLNMPSTNRLYIDGVPKPTLTAEVIEPVESAFEVAVSFNEPVTGLEEGDFLITNGTVEPGSLSTIDESHYTLIIIPAATGDVLVDLPMAVVEDSDLNGNLAAETLIVHADFDSPRTELFTEVTEPATGIFTVFIEFSEEVTGLQEYEINITNGFVSAGSLSTEDNITFILDIIPESTGNVTIQVPAGVAEDEDHFGNLASEVLVVAVLLPDNITEQNINEFYCYPNPTRGLFNLEISEEYLGSLVEIYNETGTLVFESILSEQKGIIDLVGAAQGLYLLKLTKNHKQITQRIIIE